MEQLTPVKLKELLENEEEIQLLDVREDGERSLVNIGGIHIPLGEISRRFNELDKDIKTVVYCHHGVRSAQAAGFLIQQDFSNVINLKGGIDQWSIEVDESVIRY